MKRVMYSGAGLLLIGVLFLAFNLAAEWLLRNTETYLDLTQQKLYTISSGTRQMLASLDEPIDLYFFYSDEESKELVDLRNYAQRIEELLRAYERESAGKIRLHLIDPKPFSEDEDKAAEFGLQGIPLQPGDAPIYLGLAGNNAQERGQVIPFFSPDQETFLEYDISRLVQSLAKPQQPVLGLLSTLPMEGDFDMAIQQQTPPWALLEDIRQEYQVRTLSSNLEKIPKTVDILMLVHPKGLPTSTLYAIDQFVLRGGRLLAFVDPHSEQDLGSSLFGIPSKDKSSNLEPLFKAWGLKTLEGKVLGDGRYALSFGQSDRPQREPTAVGLPAAALSQEETSTSGLESVILLTAGVLEPLKGASTALVPLMSSSNEAVLFDVADFGKKHSAADEQFYPTGERYILAARVQGPAKSAYPKGIEGQKDGLKEAKNINLIVVADTDLLSDRLWVDVQDFHGQRISRPWADNGSFVINALDSLAGSEALIGLRSRGSFSRPFKVVTALREQADRVFRNKENTLQQRLQETERKLAELQETGNDKLSPEQQAAIRQFIEEKLSIRKGLRKVRYQLMADINSLGRLLKAINIALMPLLISLAALLVMFCRRFRRARELAGRSAQRSRAS